MNYLSRILSIAIISIPGTLYSQKAIDNLFEHAGNVSSLKQMQGLTSGDLQITEDYHDFLQQAILQTTWKIEKKGKSTRNLLMTLSYGEKIFFWQLYEVRKGELKILGQKNAISKQWLSSHNLTDLDVTLLGHNGDRSVFGTSCYESGTPTPEGMLMLKYVGEHKVKELKSWLTCINPVKRIYGYFGLTLLEQNAVLSIDYSTREDMKLVYESPIPVYTCSGCMDLEYKLPQQILTEDYERALKPLNHLAFH